MLKKIFIVASTFAALMLSKSLEAADISITLIAEQDIAAEVLVSGSATEVHPRLACHAIHGPSLRYWPDDLLPNTTFLRTRFRRENGPKGPQKTARVKSRLTCEHDPTRAGPSIIF
jgi:hypothetical protein